MRIRELLETPEVLDKADSADYRKDSRDYVGRIQHSGDQTIFPHHDIITYAESGKVIHREGSWVVSTLGLNRYSLTFQKDNKTEMFAFITDETFPNGCHCIHQDQVAKRRRSNLNTVDLFNGICIAAKAIGADYVKTSDMLTTGGAKLWKSWLHHADAHNMEIGIMLRKNQPLVYPKTGIEEWFKANEAFSNSHRFPYFKVT